MFTTHLHLRAKVRNEWSCTSTPTIRVHGVDRDGFVFTQKALLVVTYHSCRIT
jgi:hypothetical protein